MNILIKICTIVISKIKNKLQFIFMKKKWRNQNSKNKTSPMNYFPIELVKVGDYSYGPLNIKYWGT
ncbi:MAG: hypothetical protein ACRC6A_04620, partial [Fusobacteriaceae bacterium]